MFSYHMQWVEFGIYYLTTKEADRYIYNHSFSARGHSEAEFLVIMQQSAGLFWSRVMAHSAAECWLILQQSAGSFCSSVLAHSAAVCWLILQQSAGSFCSRVLAHSAAECWLIWLVILQQQQEKYYYKNLYICDKSKQKICSWWNLEEFPKIIKSVRDGHTILLFLMRHHHLLFKKKGP